MSALCRSIQELLAESGPTVLQGDAGAQQHLVDCEECYAFLEALTEADDGLRNLETLDAPDAVVERAIAASREQPPGDVPESANGQGRVRRRWPLSRVQTLGSALAATLVLVSSWALISTQSPSFFMTSERSPAARSPQVAQDLVSESESVTGERQEESKLRADLDEMQRERLGALGYDGSGGSGPTSQPSVPDRSQEHAADDELSELAYQKSQSLNQRANEAFGYLDERSLANARMQTRGSASSVRRAAKPSAPAPESVAIASNELAKKDGNFADASDRIAGRLESNQSGFREKRQVAQAFVRPAEVDALVQRRDKLLGGADAKPKPADPPENSPAERFALERRQLENLSFQPAAGYWANTYVPGDPVMRWLEARLATSDRQLLQSFSANPLRLETAARQSSQHFDPPTNSALSVFVHADRRGVEGENRLLVQVGLRGADRHSRLRPSMNIGIVLDLRGTLAPETATAMRALVHAFLAAKDVGDHFSVIAAGKPGGTWVAADDFRHGPISVALERLSIAAPAPNEPTLGLEQAVLQAVEETKRGDDPSAPLGSSLVLLVTSQALGDHTSALEAIAHRSAVAGVPISAVGIGASIALDEIDRLTLAGQGNRRLLNAPVEAEALVSRELSSLSRVIARAVRLRIRLAPGVKLVEVVGSDRLDAAGAQRVRQAEKSIDRRLSRNFGIEADRGEDEEGIQIVIPTFHSGDTHSVVLDVVAPGAGPIADVTVRYKDLVYLRNGVARANLTLGRDTALPGPLERNVVKSYLAIRLSETLKQAGQALLSGQDALALALVQDFRALLASLRLEVPGYQTDPDLEIDVAMLDEYLAVLGTSVLTQSEPRNYLANSLQLSGYFKTVPHSTPDGEVHARAAQRR